MVEKRQALELLARELTRSAVRPKAAKPRHVLLNQIKAQA